MLLGGQKVLQIVNNNIFKIAQIIKSSFFNRQNVVVKDQN